MILKDQYGLETEVKIRQGTLSLLQEFDIIVLAKDEAIKLMEFIKTTYNV